MIRFKQGNMKHQIDLHGVQKLLELEGHNIDLFHDGEWTKFLVVQFLQRPNCFDMLSSKPNLVSNLEIWLIFVMDINILLVSSLCLLKVGYKLCLNVYQPHDSIVSYRIHNVVHTLDVKLGLQIMICKKKDYCVDECITLLYANSTMDKRFD